MADHREVSSAHIVQERGQLYKRNVLALSLVITVLHWVDADLGSASLFGVSLSGGHGAEAIAWIIASAILTFQMFNLLYHGLIDFDNWRKQVRHQCHLPIWHIYWPTRAGAIFRFRGNERTFKIKRVNKDYRQTIWAAIPTEQEDTEGGTEYKFDHDIRTAVRQRLSAFLFLEFGPAVLWGIASLVVAILQIADLGSVIDIYYPYQTG